MKENIRKIERYIELVLNKGYCECNELNEIIGKHCDGSKNVAYAIEHILSDYKRLQEEFKQVDHECERLEQKELRLEKEVELAKEVLKKQCDIADERNQLLIENQKLQKENEELKSSNEKLERANKCYINSIHSIVPVLNQDYISKQKIKDKIEELKNKSGGNVFHIQQTINAEIRLLQDLLEEKGE